jgi:hypothetical protein
MRSKGGNQVTQCRLVLALAASLISVVATLSVPVTVAAAAPQGEIWEWALGREAFNDPDLAPYTRGLGATIGGPCPYDYCPPAYTVTEAVVADKGFKLVPTGAEQVIGTVELYNKDNVFQPYPGRLPFGLTWDMTADQIGLVYNGPNMVPGSGNITPITFESLTPDGRYDVQVEFNVFWFHADQLPNSRMHKIAVSRGPNY